MQSLGVVLAGGAATRLPNKPLLPLKNGKPAITSALDLFNRHEVAKVAVVIPMWSAIPDVLDSLEYKIDFFIEQRQPLGVLEALTHVVGYANGLDNIVVSYSDNVFDEKVVIPERQCGIEHTSVQVHSSFRRRHLASVQSSSRSIAGYGQYAPKALRALLESYNTKQSLGFVLNHCASTMFTPLKLEGNQNALDHHWWDIGTPETYLAYWRAER
jgi:hypothetical protein